MTPRLEARLAGVLYRLSIVFGLTAVRGDEPNLAAGFLYSGMTLLLWHILLPVNKWISAIAATVSLAGCWLITTWPSLVHAIAPFPGIAGLIGEGTLMGYLIIRGLDEQKWNEDRALQLREV